jgi:integrase
MQLRWPGAKVQTVRNIGVYGAAPAMTLELAREKAKRFYQLAKAGTDPFEAEEEQRRQAEESKRAEAARRENTFAALAERYIAGRSTNRRAEADAAEIRRDLVRQLGARPVHEIAPRDLRQLIDGIKRRTPYGARAAWGHAVGIFKLAVHEELIAASPCASLDKRQLFKNAGIAPRQRTLTDDELLGLWRASGRLGFPAGPLYRVLLLTGCRLSEIAEARWSELHPELRRALREAARKNERVDWASVPAAHKILTIPRERFKSNAEHAVPLTDAACMALEGLPRFAKCDYIFTATGEGPVWLGNKWKRRLDARMLRALKALARRRGDDPTKIKLTPWINHDLRRVVRTNLSALKVDDHVAEMVLGHGRQGLQRVYDQHRYQSEIRYALERWAARLREIVEPAPTSPPAPAKVVNLSARRRAR